MMGKTVCLIVSIATVLLAINIGLGYCQPHTGEAGGMEYGIAPSASNPLNILIVYDEEIDGSSYSWFGKNIDGKTYIEHQTKRALYRFPSDWFRFRIGGFVLWDSDDSATLHDAIFEVESEIGWNKGMFYNAKWMSLLIAWTGQDNDALSGCAHLGHCSCLNKIQADWVDDNVCQHEVTHLFGIDNHCDDDGCVMSEKSVFYGWTDESLKPIEDRTVTIQIWNWQSVGLVIPEWCFEHRVQLVNSHGIPDRSPSFEGFAFDPEANPTNPKPEELGEDIPKMNPTHPEVPFVICIAVVIILAIVLLYVYKRRKDKD